MEKVKKTYDELFDILDVISQTQAQVQDEEKYQITVSKLSRKFQKLIKRYNADVFDINLKHAAIYEEGPKKNTLIRDEKDKFTYTKEGAIAKEAEIRLLNEKEISFEPCFTELTSDLIKKLGVVAVEVLTGILFQPVEEVKETIKDVVAKEAN